MSSPSPTPRLALPLMAPAQAQKHIIHNEAIIRLDALTQMSVDGVRPNAPDVTLHEGQCFQVSDNPSGEFSGQSGSIAQWREGRWIFYAPQTGWRFYNSETEIFMVYNGQAWSPMVPTTEGQPEFDHVGIGTSADPTLTLSLYGPSSLFSGPNGHQLKLDRPNETATSSLLFTTAHQAQAEIGLTGPQGLSWKVSPDGSTFILALSVDPLTGAVDCPVGLRRDGHEVYDTGSAPGLMFERGIIPNGADMNTQTDTGIYYQTSNFGASTGSNYPRPLAGTLMVRDTPLEVQQTYRLYGGAPNDEGDALFFRSLYGGVWRAWRKQTSVSWPNSRQRPPTILSQACDPFPPHASCAPDRSPHRTADCLH